MHLNEANEAAADWNSSADKDRGKAVHHQSDLSAFAAHYACSHCIAFT